LHVGASRVEKSILAASSPFSRLSSVSHCSIHAIDLTAAQRRSFETQRRAAVLKPSIFPLPVMKTLYYRSPAT
jgi:hypothetical protein